MKILLATTAILTASTAMADGVNYGRLSYDFSRFEQGSNEAELGLLQGAIEYEISQFLLFGELTNQSAENGGSLDITTLKAGAGYILSPEALIGAGLIRNSYDYDADGLEADGDTSGFEVFGQYQTAQFGVGLNISVPDTDFDDQTQTQFFGEYAVAPGIDLGLWLASDSEVDGTTYKFSADYAQDAIIARGYLLGDTDVDAGIFGARGSYAFTDQIRAAATFETTYGDDADINFVAIGGGYKITDGVWFDADYGVVSGDDIGSDIDRLQAAITFETGTRTRIDDRFAQDAINDDQAGLGSFLAISN